MGLAASQARFLGLTARKSNVEYKGQQINQARTALSNEINGLYQKYSKLDAPTPPSKQDFVKLKYVIDSDTSDYSIGNYTKIPSGDWEGYYNVTLEYTEEIPEIYPFVATNSIVTAKKDANDNFTYLNFQFGTEKYTYDSEDEKGSTVKKIVVTGEEGDTTAQKYQGLEDIMKKYGIESGTFYMFQRNGNPYYTSESDLRATDLEEKDGIYSYYGTYTFDYQGIKKVPKTADAIAALSQTTSGRLNAISIVDTEDEKLKPLIGSSYSITSSTEDDETGYADAMNQYNYNKAVYEKQVETINHKTERLQREDRSLETQLNMLDTEQNAIKTEMESISKVIEDTINSVFKTYES